MVDIENINWWGLVLVALEKKSIQIYIITFVLQCFSRYNKWCSSVSVDDKSLSFVSASDILQWLDMSGYFLAQTVLL